MFPSQMVCLKLIEPSSVSLCLCFSRKWYALKLSNIQVAHFVHVSITNGMNKNFRTLKWPTFSMFLSQMVRLKIVQPSSGPFFPCFPRKWYALILSNSQVVHFFHVSLAYSTPQNCRTLNWPTFSMFPSQMVRLKIVKPSSSELCPCFPRKWYALKLSNPRGPLFPCFPRKYYVLKLSNPQVTHFFHLSIANGTP